MRLADPIAEFKTVNARHDHAGEHHVEPAGASGQFRQGFLGIGGPHDSSPSSWRIWNKGADVRVVLNYQIMDGIVG